MAFPLHLSGWGSSAMALREVSSLQASKPSPVGSPCWTGKKLSFFDNLCYHYLITPPPRLYLETHMNPNKQKYLELIQEFPLIMIRDEETLSGAINIAIRLERKNAVSRLTVDEYEYLEVLKRLIDDYQHRQSRFPNLDPHHALTRLMNEHRMTQTDLIAISGEYKTNVSAFLKGKRNISRSVAEKLAEYFNVSPDLFIPKMDLSSRATIYCDGGIFGGLFTEKLVIEKLNPKLKSGHYELEPYSYKPPFPPYYPVYVWLPNQVQATENNDSLEEEIKQTYAELTEAAHTYRPNNLEERQEQCAKLIERLNQLASVTASP
jgi:HTH-type transcriptional regulator / antitoxin HigA